LTDGSNRVVKKDASFLRKRRVFFRLFNGRNSSCCYKLATERKATFFSEFFSFFRKIFGSRKNDALRRRTTLDFNDSNVRGAPLRRDWFFVFKESCFSLERLTRAFLDVKIENVERRRRTRSF